jgi:hypothetical protein
VETSRCSPFHPLDPMELASPWTASEASVTWEADGDVANKLQLVSPVPFFWGEGHDRNTFCKLSREDDRS